MPKDFVFALRNMVRNPGLTAAAVLTLALGIGANTAMFSVIHAVLLRPLPFREPDRLVSIYARIPRLKIEGAHVEYNTFVEFWRPRNRSFEAMAAISPGSATLTSGELPERVRTERVSASFLDVIGSQTAYGRGFLPEEDKPGAPRVAILSDGLWKRRFGADRAIIGRSIVLDRNDYTVVGVLPASFDLVPADILTPIAHSGARAPGMPSVGTYARLKRGVTLEQAQSDINSLCAAWLAQYPYPRDWGAAVAFVKEDMVRHVKPSILVLGVAVALVLLIACANVANLLLARGAARQKEIAIRAALGAGRGRIVRQLLTESALLGTVAAAVGVLIAWGSVRGLVSAEVALPFRKDLAVNLPVLAFTAAATLLTTFLFGLAPAIAAAREAVAANLKEGRGAGESAAKVRFRSALVVAEVALALLLVTGATLALRSLVRLQAVNPGFNPDGVFTAGLALPAATYPQETARVNFFKTVVERVRAIPGVTSAGLASDLPFSGSKSGNDVRAEGAPPPKPGDQMIAFHRMVDPGYFQTIQARLLRGRFFSDRDAPGAPLVGVINDAMARRCWPGQDPVGQRFVIGRTGPSVTVAGVIADMRQTSLDSEPDFEYFLPHAMRAGAGMTLVVRTQGDPMRIASGVRAAVAGIDKDIPVANISTLAESVSRSTKTRRLLVTLFLVFAGLALLLASIGIYGVISYTVTRRVHEIGVRIALGAAGSRIARMVVNQALTLGALGVALGVAGGLALTRLMRSMLFGVSATDPATFTGAALFLLAVCGIAAYIPARRAANVDPLLALREE